jgi:FAD/FMN-containing dehydrogenase
MTVTVETGLTLGALQAELAAHQQWLPIDPPHADRLPIHDLLAQNLSGPRRYGYGTIREHVIGMRVLLADGRIIKSGGKVVKNVAGYDLMKLFIGAGDSLGIIVEVTFKVRPRPQMEQFVSRQISCGDAGKCLRSVLDSDVTPVVVDMHRATGKADFKIVLGFAGTIEEVEWQLGMARQLGFADPASLDYETSFWAEGGAVQRASILPSRLAAAVEEVGDCPFVARAGNGTIYYRGAAASLPAANGDLPVGLMRRIKAAYDPRDILPNYES